MSASVWIGDLLTAWDAEDRDASRLEKLVELLGLSTVEVEDKLTVDDEPFEGFLKAAAGGVGGLGPGQAFAEPRMPVVPGNIGAAANNSPTPQRQVRALRVEQLPAEPPTRPIWSGEALREASSPHVPQRLQPLFPHATARALVGAAAHSIRNVGQVDINEAINVVATRRPVREIPRDTARTMRAGIQLVIDRTWAMKPFADDIAVLRKQLFTVVGRDRIDELWFSGDLASCRRPLRVAARPRANAETLRAKTYEPWQPPEGGIPVIVVADLGRADEQQGNSSVAAEWKRLFVRAADAGCEVVTIIPRRVDGADRHNHTTPVAWDTRTTAGKVIADRGKRHG